MTDCTCCKRSTMCLQHALQNSVFPLRKLRFQQFSGCKDLFSKHAFLPPFKLSHVCLLFFPFISLSLKWAFLFSKFPPVFQRRPNALWLNGVKAGTGWYATDCGTPKYIRRNTFSSYSVIKIFNLYILTINIHSHIHAIRFNNNE